MLSHTPIRGEGDTAVVLEVLQDRLTEFVASIETPGAQFVSELLEF